MKTMRKKWLLPIAVFAIAIASAFASNSGANNVLATPGYIDAPAPCRIAVDCSPFGGPVCRNASLQQAFGWNSMHTACNVELYKP
ncbi:DUF6520 family protein [Aequorivita flava]|uniref:DUF6520 family protein n=1 Tax=Aequorivita flava TaxID=3114371 RepID=A0AB35YSH2_9FLAO